MAIPGHGGRVQSDRFIVRSGLQRMSLSGDGVEAGASASDLVSVVGAALDGCQSVLGTGSIRGGVDTAAGLARSIRASETLAASADSLRCMRASGIRTWRICMTLTSAALCRPWRPIAESGNR